MGMTQPVRKSVVPPAGCEGYLTRQQAARALGFASEFKIRDLERKGMLRSVRGAMGTAFYPRSAILAVKARLTSMDPENVQPDAWSDAELLTLLDCAKPTGGWRTAYDLVLETGISIERALRVCEFRQRCAPDIPTTTEAPETTPRAAKAEATPTPVHSTSATHERRRTERLGHDALIRNLRHPDPRVREDAFAKLKEQRERADARGTGSA